MGMVVGALVVVVVIVGAVVFMGGGGFGSHKSSLDVNVHMPTAPASAPAPH
jgi:hypothetical protein